MDETLKNIYYNPIEGFCSIDELHRKAKKLLPKITKKEAQEWMMKQRVVQQNKKVTKINYHIIISDGFGYQEDVMFLDNPGQNDKYIGLLTFINTSTRFARVCPISNKKTNTYLGHIKEFIENTKCTSLTTDNEFYNNDTVRKLLYEYKIDFYVEEPYEHSKLGIINRFHRTLRDLLNKYFIAYNTDRWIDVIDDIIKNYNTRKHRTLGCSPNDITFERIDKLNERLRFENERSMDGFHSFQVGDKVRVLLKKDKFEKGSLTFSSKIYTISKIDKLSFIVKINNKELKRRYKYYELMKVKESEEPPVLTLQPPKARSANKKTREVRRERERNRLQIDMKD